jgi:hypothetical protein
LVRGQSDAASFELQDTGVDLPGPIWDRHPDGRLLVHTVFGDAAAAGEAQPPRLVVVSNWIRALEERLGAGGSR